MHGSAVSPDGQWVAFRSFDQATGVTALEVVASSGGVPRELFRVEKGENIPGFTPLEWTPDGLQVLFTKGGSDPQDLKFELWRFAAEDGKAETVDLAMDGLRVAFTAGQYAYAEVWVMENFLPTLQAAK